MVYLICKFIDAFVSRVLKLKHIVLSETIKYILCIYFTYYKWISNLLMQSLGQQCKRWFNGVLILYNNQFIRIGFSDTTNAKFVQRTHILL